MSNRLLIVGCWLMLFGGLSLIHVEAQDPKPTKKEAKNDPQAVADLLDKRIDLPTLDDPTVTLSNVLEFIEKEHGLHYRVNWKALAAEGIPPREIKVAEEPIPEMKNTRISAVIQRILERVPSQSGAHLVIRRDGIEITTGEFLRQEIWGKSFEGPFLPLVRINVAEQPFNKVLVDLANQSDRNIIVDPRLKEKADQKVTVSFVNAPLDTVILFLCTITDSDLVIRDNVIFVTTKENAATLKARFKAEEKQADLDDPDVTPGPRIGTDPKLHPSEDFGIAGGAGLLGSAPQLRPGVQVGGAKFSGPAMGGLGFRPVKPLHFVSTYPVNYVEKAPAKPKTLSKGEMAQTLEKKVNFKEIDDPQATLEQVLQFLSREHGLRFRVDERAFKNEGVEDVLASQVAEIPLSAMTNVRLSDVLQAICDRIQSLSGVQVLITPEYLEITTRLMARERIWGKANWFPYLPSVHLQAEKQTVAKALQRTAILANRNVMLDPRVKKQLATAVSFQLCNTPLDTAFLFLTNLADLDFVLRDNFLFVTDKASASKLRKQFVKESGADRIPDVGETNRPRIGEVPENKPEVELPLDRMQKQRLEQGLDDPFPG